MSRAYREARAKEEAARMDFEVGESFLAIRVALAVQETLDLFSDLDLIEEVIAVEDTIDGVVSLKLTSAGIGRTLLETIEEKAEARVYWIKVLDGQLAVRFEDER